FHSCCLLEPLGSLHRTTLSTIFSPPLRSVREWGVPTLIGRREFVEVLEKSMKDLEQAKEKDNELFEETIEQEKKLNEEKFETFKKETNDKLARALIQLKEQPSTPHSA
ncbi:hypothetical protein Tco_1411934, partial [Tanacetum coccineum]